jgi:hypothetical protein
MIEQEVDQTVLARLVGYWEGMLRHRPNANEPLRSMACMAESRWVLGGRFVEMTLRSTGGHSWSAVFYIGYESSGRRHLLVSLDPGAQRIRTCRGEWHADADRVVMLSDESRTVCDLGNPGALRVEWFDEGDKERTFLRFWADYRTAEVPAAPALSARQPRRSVIA